MNIRAWPAAKVCGAIKVLFDTGAFAARTKDNAIMSSFGRYIRDRGYITPKQVDFARIKLLKYVKQLSSLSIPDCGSCSGDQLVFTMHNPKTLRIYAPKNSPILTPIKRIAGFQENDSYSLLPFSKRNCYVLLHLGFVMGPRVQDFFCKPGNSLQMPDFSVLLRQPKPYQKEGIAFLLAKDGRAILADEQGLGKTGQAIAWAEIAKVPKICVVCPASLKMNWQKEIEIWTGSTNSIILSGTKIPAGSLDLITAHRWVIINYDILSAWQAILQDAAINAFIFDEAQALKNTKSKRSVIATALSKKKQVLLLSGTPCENRPAEFYPLINIVDPLLFPSKTHYYMRYCDLKETRFGIDVSGASNTKELNKILMDTIMIRRRKMDVLHDLPDKQRIIVPLYLAPASLREYKMIESDFVSWLKQNDLLKKGREGKKQLKAQAMLKIGKLKQAVALAKLPLVVDWIKTYLENEQKLVVFAEHKQVISFLADQFSDRAVVVDGSTPSSKRQALCEAFQTNPDIHLFVGNIKAAGTGITLTAAKDTLTIEFAWTSTAHDQCEDRVHRIGQENAVSAYYLLAQGTIEEDLIALLDKKRQLISQVMDGVDPVNEDLLDQLLKRYEDKDKNDQNKKS